MRVVITGGCGFLGRRVAQRLLDRGDVDELVLFDNAPPVPPLPDDKRLRVVTGDIADREAVSRV
ncbi:MAG: NAD-dependent epimerase/dehydratase family protein, partial [Alphaproteobacteria bacterium]|nr:NAD-dependent epimerase/dehydratase family protein [Alphaproteobacteria bacterium]